LQFHIYADDTQLYLSFDAKFTKSVDDQITLLKNCMDRVGLWMATNYLKVNNDKTELIILGGSRQLKMVNLNFKH